MYSGTTIRVKSGRILGAHQKIDRVAYRLLMKNLPKKSFFPTISDIVHFEGRNGPDGIKSKSPGKDEPWHFIDPKDPERGDLLAVIEDHYRQLVDALTSRDEAQSAFEAAWLAHALVDGLTPAHHFPFEDRLTEIRGEGMETRDSLRRKLLMPGTTRRELIRNNWQFWGAKGVFTSHFMFEWGFAAAIAPRRLLHWCEVTPENVRVVQNEGIRMFFLPELEKIATKDMYSQYLREGWTRQLAHEVTRHLAPHLISVVATAWLAAIEESRT